MLKYFLPSIFTLIFLLQEPTTLISLYWWYSRVIIFYNIKFKMKEYHVIGDYLKI